jgi:hypothetical protein
MSRIGRWLLEQCSDDMKINLKSETVQESMRQHGLRPITVRLIAIHLGVTIEGGS